MKKLIFIFVLFLSFSMQSQENELLAGIKQFDDGIKQLKYVLDLKVDSIPEDGFSKLLKIKVNSELNTLGDIFVVYADGKELELSRKEQSILENRAKYFAEQFVKNNRYAIVKSSGGAGPITGVHVETISEKKVVVLLMGGDCTLTERDKRLDYIYDLFSTKVRTLLNP